MAELHSEETPMMELVASAAAAPAQPVQFETLMAYGAASVTLALFAYAHEKISPNCALLCAAGCLMAAVYGFVQGAWPLGIAQLVWAVAAVRRWRAAIQRRSRQVQRRRAAVRRSKAEQKTLETTLESRLSRMFGP
jgi:uncharacterized protein YhaN